VPLLDEEQRLLFAPDELAHVADRLDLHEQFGISHTNRSRAREYLRRHPWVTLQYSQRKNADQTTGKTWEHAREEVSTIIDTASLALGTSP